MGIWQLQRGPQKHARARVWVCVRTSDAARKRGGLPTHVCQWVGGSRTQMKRAPSLVWLAPIEFRGLAPQQAVCCVSHGRCHKQGHKATQPLPLSHSTCFFLLLLLLVRLVLHQPSKQASKRANLFVDIEPNPRLAICARKKKQKKKTRHANNKQQHNKPDQWEGLGQELEACDCKRR